MNNMASRSVSPRAQHRLEIARRLLRLPGDADVLSHIKAMPKEESDRLRSQVDWVEDYESIEEFDV